MIASQAVETLRTVGWLSRQSDAFVEAILAVGRVLDVAPGEQLYSLGDEAGGLFGVASGHVDVLIAPGPFPPMLVHIGSPGWWVGDAALITHTRRRAELRARGPVQALFLSEANIETIAAGDPQIWRRLAEISVSHLDDALSLAACLAARDRTRRLVLTLLRLAGPTAARATTVSIPITQGELGEIAGLSRNSVVRLLRRPELTDAVQSSYRHIVIRPERLRDVLWSGRPGHRLQMVLSAFADKRPEADHRKSPQASHCRRGRQGTSGVHDPTSAD